MQAEKALIVENGTHAEEAGADNLTVMLLFPIPFMFSIKKNSPQCLTVSFSSSLTVFSFPLPVTMSANPFVFSMSATFGFTVC